MGFALLVSTFDKAMVDKPAGQALIRFTHGLMSYATYAALPLQIPTFMGNRALFFKKWLDQIAAKHYPLVTYRHQSPNR